MTAIAPLVCPSASSEMKHSAPDAATDRDVQWLSISWGWELYDVTRYKSIEPAGYEAMYDLRLDAELQSQVLGQGLGEVYLMVSIVEPDRVPLQTPKYRRKGDQLTVKAYFIDDPDRRGQEFTDWIRPRLRALISDWLVQKRR